MSQAIAATISTAATAAATAAASAIIDADGAPDARAGWTAICPLHDIVRDTGVCALVDGAPVAVFRVGADDSVFAISNFDPNSGASVLSRGLVGSLGERIVVASPIYKQHFDLRTGECLEAPEHAVAAYRARVHGGHVWVAPLGSPTRND